MKTESGENGSCEVVVLGEYYCDLIYHNLDGLPELGKEVLSDGFDTLPGGSFTPALSLTRLGVKALWQCCLGTDTYSAFIRDQARREGIDDRLFQELDRPLQRVTTVFSINNDRGFVTFIDGPEPEADIDRILQYNPAILLFQGLSGLVTNLGLARQAKSKGVLVLSDCGHVETSLADKTIAAALSQVDVFMPNLDEAKTLTGEQDKEKVLARLSEIVPRLVIKAGSEGAIGFDRGQIYTVPARKVELVDPTGAGDSFNAGFVFGLLRGESFENAMQLGVCNSSVSITDLGGRAVPDQAKLLTEWNKFSK